MRLPSIPLAALLVASALINAAASSSVAIYDRDELPSGTSSPLHDAIDDAHSSAPTLKPIVPRHIDTESFDTLLPKPYGTVHYHDSTKGGKESKEPYLFAEANMTFQYPTVLLPHSSYIKSVTCLGGKTGTYGIEIDFNNAKAFEFVEEHWSKDHRDNQEGFLIVTESLQCNEHGNDDNVHVYWLVEKLDFEDENQCYKVKVAALEIDVKNACDEVSIDWGTKNPDGGDHDGHSWSSDGNIGKENDGGNSHDGHGGDGGKGGKDNNSGDKDVPGGTTPGGSNPGGSTPPDSGSGSPSCLNPPSSYLGLPTAPCGPDFDQVLDAKIGFLNLDNQAEALQFAPGLEDGDVVERELIEGLGRRGLVKRGWSFKKAWKKLATVAKAKVINVIRTTIATQVNKVVAKAKAIVKPLVTIVQKALTALSSFSFRKVLSFSAKPTPQVNSPFGSRNSYLLFSSNSSSTSSNIQSGSSSTSSSSTNLDMYCVDCGFNGTTTIAGGLRYKLFPPQLTRADVSMSGSLYAGANLGIVASGTYTQTYTKNLGTFPIVPVGFTIANFLTVGAAVTLDATADVNVNAKGRLLVGADVSIPNFVARLNALSTGPQSTISGFEPQFRRRFDAAGEVRASLGLGLPAELGVGLRIPSLKLDKRIGLRNTPKLLASAVLRGTTNPHDTSYCINGLAYDVGVSNSIDFDLAGKLSNLALFRKDHIFADCFLIPGITRPSGGSSSSRRVSKASLSSSRRSSSSTSRPISSVVITSSYYSSAASIPTSTSASFISSTSSYFSSASESSYFSSAAPSVSASESSYYSSAPESSYYYSSASASDTSSYRSDPAPESSYYSSIQPSVSAIDRRHNRRQEITITSTEAPSPTLVSAADGSTLTSPTPLPESMTITVSDPAFSPVPTPPLNGTTSETNPDLALDPTIANFLDRQDTTSPFLTTEFNEAINASYVQAEVAQVLEGFDYLPIYEFSGEYVLATTGSGNLGLDMKDNAPYRTWATTDGQVVVGAGGEFPLFYYPDEITATGVSRLRTNDLSHIPKSANMISLLPFKYEDATTDGIYIAVDSLGQIFYLVECSLANELESKIFLVNDVDRGLSTLSQKEELQYTITGGVVEQCDAVALKATIAGY
ncbi:hypothetical protein IAR55_005197 [Kwoniella newhampshirensis]|uniref:Peptidase A1 domain-containing protein n=1 Tax=Kwoniella newhampshirensis TaxID=1651941 RepID=A0AAW0YVU5_9TREE